jgi:hypothetical protein
MSRLWGYILSAMSLLTVTTQDVASTVQIGQSSIVHALFHIFSNNTAVTVVNYQSEINTNL